MAMFKAFKPEAMNKIAKAMGYSGDMGQFQSYIEQDPARKARMDGFVKAAQTMAKGGMVKKMQTGGSVQPLAQAAVPQQGDMSGKTITDIAAERAFTPGMPTGATITPVGTVATPQQDINIGAGQVAGTVAVPTAQAGTALAAQPAQ